MIRSTWLYRFALLLVVLGIAAIVSGAILTSTEVAARLSQPDVFPMLNPGLHRVLSIALALLMSGFALWITTSPAPGWIRTSAWSAVAVLALGGALGLRTAPLSPEMGVVHALLAHVFLALIVAIAVGASSGWDQPPELAQGPSRPLLRPAAIATPPIVLLQIALGAIYRHNLSSVLPHMAVAMAVAFLALINASVVLQNFPKPSSLRRAAGFLIAIVLTQVCLGISAFLLLLLNYAGTPYFIWVTVAHVLTGAATLAASVVMAVEVRRSIPPKQPSAA